ncbi:tripartite tricarboxylate transporter permease [Herbaspirillum sp. alder98]|uniref:tripartite tricarboxylate transporter permease n=1 Tax=Herbaspirillum sp. alder98 TaxID=2913096 RepID=UPI001CD885B3|nr:tripartite tricarboxylate transporter permease [Herbaspirillum sp. alder98]MCA1322853.1 tripartite tricarboxylate transporter permease [Herbaspirillum sp. alder98]
MDPLMFDIVSALGFSLMGAVLFSAIGLVSGTDETTTLAPLTMLVVLLGAPPASVLAFFIAGAVAKHMTHAVPTALLGIPGDTSAVALIGDANVLRRLGVPHIALRKMLSGGAIAALIAVPVSIAFAVVLAPFGEMIKQFAPWVFLSAALLIAYFSAGRWAAMLALVPFVLLIVALQTLTAKYGTKLSVSYFLGIAVAPLIASLFSLLSPQAREGMRRQEFKVFSLAPDVKAWKGYFPNPFKVMSRRQAGVTAAAAAVSSATFVFSPVAMAVVVGELIGGRIKQAYERVTTVITARNGISESTYIAETLIPLIAFGLPLSPVAAGPAGPLFNAPPRFSVDTATGQVNNLHNMLSIPEFFWFTLMAVVIALVIAYPFAMNYAHNAASFVARKVSHEAVIATFIGLVLVIGLWEGGILGLMVILSIGMLGGFLERLVGFNIGVQFMGYYTAVLSVPALIAAFK